MRAARIAVLTVTLTLAVVLCAAAAGAGWLLYTEPGLVWLSARVVGIAGKGLILDGVAGTLAGGARAQQIRYAGEDIVVKVRDAYFRVSPWSLVMLTPRISDLRAADVAVVAKPGEPRGRPPDTLELPVSFQLPEAKLARLTVDLGKGPIELTDVALDYSGGSKVHRIHRLTLVGYEHALELSGTVDARAPFALEAKVAIVRSAAPKAALDATAAGNLGELMLAGTVTSGKAGMKARATVEPYAALPLARLAAHLDNLDLQAFAKAWPHTLLAGDIELERSGTLLIGPVRLTNAAPGPYDTGRVPVASLRVDVRTDMTKVRTFRLSADLGRAGALSGNGSLEGETATLALETRNLDLSGLHSRMRKTQLKGHADLTLSQASQAIVADVSQHEVTLSFAAQRTGDHVAVSRFLARARGGEARGTAKIALAGRRPFSVDAAFSRFDPAAWGDFPGGSINGTALAKGFIEPLEADVQLAIRDSRWLGAPLAARGRFDLAGERVRQANVTASIGGNDFSAKGALGAPSDTLALTFDAPKLGVLLRDVRGSARGSAQLTGRLRAPAVRFDFTASGLEYKKLARVKSVQAQGNLSTESAGPFTAEATLRGIVVPEWQLESAALRVRGTPAAHEIALDARGERVDLHASARGGWKQGTGWTGTLEELVNRGEAAVRLVAPVAIVAGPQRIRTGAFELRVVGGQLVVRALDYESGHLSTEGRFLDLPVRPLLAIAGGPAPMAGSLRLSGRWSMKTVPPLVGTVSVTRESGDLDLGADRGMQLGLQALSVSARFGPDGATFQADVRSALATANVNGRVSPVGSGEDARFSAASPMSLESNVEVARLAPFAALVGTAVLLDGKAQAKLAGRGTIGDPLVTGPIVAEGVAVALPSEGIDLKGGTLRASLERNEIRVESFSIRGGEGVLTAQGTLARTGFDEASVNWSAKNFTVLARPDRRLVVSGKGHAALHGGKLAFTGALRAEEGLFELSTTTLPQLGDDVVVIRRNGPKPKDADARREEVHAKRTTRAAVDLSVDLGNNVHLLGRGLDVWLGGSLRVQTNAQGELQAVGTVDARRGTFVAYGQRLEIERGRLYFNGPISNPGLDFLAMRKRQAVEAGVAVTGTMAQPVVRVVSNPPLPEGEALSWLVLGRAPSEAGAGQLSALPLATGALMGKAGAPLAKALNVDEVGLRSGQAVSEQFVTVGKRITDRLYLAFEQSLGGTESLLRLEMSLTERIALRAQTGLTSSVGVFYRYVWD
ncbi:MAG: translocation/assembly module TamB domain-containing protein [Burkholderiales bacterium]